MSDVLNINKLTKVYTRRHGDTVAALSDVSVNVQAGKFKVVHGPSGSGKSTLLLAAGGLLHPESGTVAVDGQDIYALSSEKRAGFRARNIGYVFQQFHLIPYLSVLDNVLAPSLAFTNGQVLRRAEELVDFFGLSGRSDHPPSELSTGERQRVALARALLHKPKLLLADEPTGNLDETNAANVINYLRQFAADGGAVLVVTHDSKIDADEKYHIEEGFLVNNSGSPVSGNKNEK